MINLFAPIDMNTGIGIRGYNIWKNLFELNDKIALFPINNVASIEPDWNKDKLQQSFNNQKLFNKSYPCLKIWYGFEMFNRIVGDSPYYGFVSHYLDKLRPEEINGFNILDKIFVPTNWSKQILLKNNIQKDIVVCPYGIDDSIFNGIIPEDKNEEKYIFINIAKWEVRKAHDSILDLFNLTFTKDDNVELWMINYNPYLSDEDNKKWIEYYKNSPLSDKIKIFPRLPSQKSLAKIIGYADCGLCLSRSENWNSSALEIMAMNKPLIITDYSAHTEYCNKDNSYLINIDKIEPADDGLFFNNYGNWSCLDDNQIQQTIDYMRFVYRNNIRSNNSGIETARKYTWEKTAQILYENIV